MGIAKRKATGSARARCGSGYEEVEAERKTEEVVGRYEENDEAR